MDQRKIEKTTKEVEKHLEELIKVKLMRVLSESVDSKKVANKWIPLLQLLDTIHPGSLEKLEKVVKESLKQKKIPR